MPSFGQLIPVFLSSSWIPPTSRPAKNIFQTQPEKKRSKEHRVALFLVEARPCHKATSGDTHLNQSSQAWMKKQKHHWNHQLQNKCPKFWMGLSLYRIPVRMSCESCLPNWWVFMSPCHPPELYMINFWRNNLFHPFQPLRRLPQRIEPTISFGGYPSYGFDPALVRSTQKIFNNLWSAEGKLGETNMFWPVLEHFTGSNLRLKHPIPDLRSLRTVELKLFGTYYWSTFQLSANCPSQQNRANMVNEIRSNPIYCLTKSGIPWYPHRPWIKKTFGEAGQDASKTSHAWRYFAWPPPSSGVLQPCRWTDGRAVREMGFVDYGHPSHARHARGIHF